MDKNEANKNEVEETTKEETQRDTNLRFSNQKVSTKVKISTVSSLSKVKEIAKEVLRNIKSDYNLEIIIYNLGYGQEKLTALKNITELLEEADYKCLRARRAKAAQYQKFANKFKTVRKKFDSMLRLCVQAFKSDTSETKLLPEQIYKSKKLYEKLNKMQEFSSEIKKNTVLKNSINKYHYGVCFLNCVTLSFTL